MNIRLVGIFVVLVTGLCSCTDPDSGLPPPPEFDVTAHTNAWLNLWRTYDLDLVDQLFLNDSRLSYLSSEREGVLRGLDEVRDHHSGFGFVSGGADPPNELWLEEVVSSIYGSSAVVSARWFFGDRSADRDSIQQGPMTAVYVLSGDRYKIAHMQFADY